MNDLFYLAMVLLTIVMCEVRCYFSDRLSDVQRDHIRLLEQRVAYLRGIVDGSPSEPAEESK